MKLTEYQSINELNQNDILITDGSRGTKKIYGKNLAKSIQKMNDVRDEATILDPTDEFDVKRGAEHLKITFENLAKLITSGTDLDAIKKALDEAEKEIESMGSQIAQFETTLLRHNSGIAQNTAGVKKNADDIAALSLTVDAAMSKLTSVYKYKGACAITDLPTSDMEIGDTYNITTEFTAPDIFNAPLDGTGVLHPAGTNVSWNGTAWDCLAGVFDASDLEAAIAENARHIQTNTSSINLLQGRMNGAEDLLTNHTISINAMQKQIDKAADAIIVTTTSVIDDLKKQVKKNTDNISVNTASIKALQTGLGNAVDDILTNTTSIRELQKHAANIDKVVTEHTSSISNLNQQIVNATNTLIQMTTSISNIQNQVEILDPEGLTADLTDIKDTLDGVTEQIDEITKDDAIRDKNIEFLATTTSIHSQKISYLETYTLSIDINVEANTQKIEQLTQQVQINSTSINQNTTSIQENREWAEGEFGKATEKIKINTSSIKKLQAEVDENKIAILDRYTKQETNELIQKKLGSTYRYKGSVHNFEDLPKEGMEVGDVYNVKHGFRYAANDVLEDRSDDNIKDQQDTNITTRGEFYPAGTNVAWDGEQWDPLAGLFDTSELDEMVAINTSSINRLQGIVESLDIPEGFDIPGLVDNVGKIFTEVLTNTVSINQMQTALDEDAVKIETNTQDISNLKTKTDSTNNRVKNLEDNTYNKTQVDQRIGNAIAGVYKVQGSCTFDELPNPEEEEVNYGDVWNVTTEFTADARFTINEIGNKYPAGTNVVWTEDGWDCMAGVFDFSPIEEKITSVETKTNSNTASLTEQEESIGQLFLNKLNNAIAVNLNDVSLNDVSDEGIYATGITKNTDIGNMLGVTINTNAIIIVTKPIYGYLHQIIFLEEDKKIIMRRNKTIHVLEFTDDSPIYVLSGTALLNTLQNVANQTNYFANELSIPYTKDTNNTSGKEKISTFITNIFAVASNSGKSTSTVDQILQNSQVKIPMMDFGMGTNLKSLSPNEFIPFRLGIDANGNYGYYKRGADTVTPFLSDLQRYSGSPFILFRPRQYGFNLNSSYCLLLRANVWEFAFYFFIPKSVITNRPDDLSDLTVWIDCGISENTCQFKQINFKRVTTEQVLEDLPFVYNYGIDPDYNLVFGTHNIVEEDFYTYNGYTDIKIYKRQCGYFSASNFCYFGYQNGPKEQSWITDEFMALVIGKNLRDGKYCII